MTYTLHVLTYKDEGTVQNRNLVLKTYLENIVPVLKAYIHDEDLRKCVREFQALRSLGAMVFLSQKHIFVSAILVFLVIPL